MSTTRDGGPAFPGRSVKQFKAGLYPGRIKEMVAQKGGKTA